MIALCETVMGWVSVFEVNTPHFLTCFFSFRFDDLGFGVFRVTLCTSFANGMNSVITYGMRCIVIKC